MITEPTLFLERKGLDGVQINNCLKILISSNDDWVVPAGERARRHVVLKVPNKCLQNVELVQPDLSRN